MTKRMCVECEAWRPLPNQIASDWGECRLHAPVVQMDPTLPDPWPHTKADDWCLDFRELEALRALKARVEDDVLADTAWASHNGEAWDAICAYRAALRGEGK